MRHFEAACGNARRAVLAGRDNLLFGITAGDGSLMFASIQEIPASFAHYGSPTHRTIWCRPDAENRN